MFGEIVNSGMVLNKVGQIVESVWSRLSEHFSSINLDECMIMPNHFHGIILISERVKQDSPALPAFDVNADIGCIPDKGKADEALALPLHALRGSVSGSLCSIVQNFKSISARKINLLRNNPGCPVWQRNYYERVIRDENELSRAREYIVNNPMKWELDAENPINFNT